MMAIQDEHMIVIQTNMLSYSSHPEELGGTCGSHADEHVIINRVNI